MLMNAHQSRSPGSIASGLSWRYKPAHGGVGALLLCAACLLMVRLMLLMFQDDVIKPEKVHEAIAVGVAAFVMFYFGSTLLFSLITGFTLRLSISEDGVRYGSQFYSWDRVQWIDARFRRGNLQVHVTMRSGLFRKKWLIVDDGLSDEQWKRIEGELITRVRLHYPHLMIGESSPPVDVAPAKPKDESAEEHRDDDDHSHDGNDAADGDGD